MADAAFAVLVLLVATTLSVYKPWGLTPYHQRKEQQQQRLDYEMADAGLPSGLKILVAVFGVLLVVFAVLHHTGGGRHGH